MNDSDKLHEIYGFLVNLSSKVSVHQCLDCEMLSFSDCVDNGSHKVFLSGVSLISSDIRKDIEEAFKIIDL